MTVPPIVLPSEPSVTQMPLPPLPSPLLPSTLVPMRFETIVLSAEPCRLMPLPPLAEMTLETTPVAGSPFAARVAASGL